MIPRTSIEEANKHLNLLHRRVGELEKTVTDQHDALRIKDEQLKNKIAEISFVKNTEIESLGRKLRESEQTVVILQNQIQQKDEVIERLQQGLSSVETLLNHKTSMENLLHAMKAAEKGLKEVGISSEPTTQGPVQRKDLHLNGFSGSLSSQEEKTETTMKSGEAKAYKSKSKRHGGKEFYL